MGIFYGIQATNNWGYISAPYHFREKLIKEATNFELKQTCAEYKQYLC